MAGAARAREPELAPFRLNTRQRIQQNQSDGTKPLVIGQTTNYNIDKVGFLSGFILKISGTVTLGAAGAIVDRGPIALLDRVRVTLLNGNITVVDVSGPHLELLNRVLWRGFAPSGNGVYTPSTSVWSVPVAMAANPWALHLFIPIGANFHTAFDTGLINAQSSQNTITVGLQTTTAGTNFVSQFTSMALTAEIHNVYYDVPPPNMVKWPLNQLVRTIQATENITAVGDVKHEVERQGRLMQLIGEIRTNGARNNSAELFTLRTNNNNYIYQEAASIVQAQYESNYSQPCGVGLYNRDLWHAYEQPSAGDLRDTLNLENFTKTEWIARIAPGTPLGSGGTSFFDVTRRALVNLAR
jgi:hypothetical protein